jgi:hypothetical protein
MDMNSNPKTGRLLAAVSLAGTLMLAAAVPAGASTGTPSDEGQPNPIMCFLTGGGQACFGEGGGGGGGEKQPSATPADEGNPNPNPIMCVIQGGQNCFGQGGGGEGGGEKGGGEKGGGESGGGGSEDGPQAVPADEGPKPNPNPIMCLVQGGQNCFGGGGGEKQPQPQS